MIRTHVEDDKSRLLLLAGVRVLLVDDDDDIRDAFQAVLEHFGAIVMPVASAAAALTALACWPADVLLSDLAMPGESGYDLMHQVAMLAGAPPAAALTAYCTADGEERAFAAGFRLYLGKPIGLKRLVAAVADLAGRSLAPPGGDLH